MSFSWIDMTPRLLDAAAWPLADPYLRIADATQYVDHLLSVPADPTLPVSVELGVGATRPAVAGMTVPAAYPPNSQFFTAAVSVPALNALLKYTGVTRVQFAEGVLPQRPYGAWVSPWPVSPVAGKLEGPPEPIELLLGVIDDGCPFAHADLRRPDGLRTRIVGLWDQGDASNLPPSSMGYGWESDETQLNRLMASATDGQGLVDEHLCYLRGGAQHALGRVSHGAHALGLLAALRRHAGDPQSPLHPPVYDKPGEASAAAIAFVQLPRKVLDAAFPPAVERHALDGLRYLLQTGLARGASRVWVSFAFESWLGSHDETGWFGKAVADLTTQAAASGVDLRVFMVAGNSGASNVHLQIVNGAQPPGDGRQASVYWRLQPDDQCVTHIEVWVPDVDDALDSFKIEITLPDGSTLPSLGWGVAVAWPQPAAAAVCVVMDDSGKWGRRANVVVLRLSPSQVFDARQRAAPHGEWSMKLTADNPLDGVHVYIGRGTQSFGSPRRGRQAVLTRRTVDQQQDDRYGTLNGPANHLAATVATCSVAMSCIYSGPYSQLQPGGAAPYAGFGPSRDGMRQGPSFAVAVEQGVYHFGFPSIGNRSATTFRLQGTSVAAPLGARMALDGDACQSNVPPDNWPTKEKEIGICTCVPR